MHHLLSRQHTYDLEEKITHSQSITLEQLMIEAGASIWHQSIHHYGAMPKTVCIFLGSGNNAGDALIFALHAIKQGVNVELIQVSPPKSNLLKHVIRNNPKLKQLFLEKPSMNHYDIIIDGMFGIGYKLQQNEKMNHWINIFNQLNGFKIAIDIPSGIDANSGYAYQYCIVDMTITFFAKKIGHLFSFGKSAQRKIIISLKYYFDNQYGYNEISYVKLEDRVAHVHKYQCGNVSVIGGSQGMEGAGLLSALAALRSGVGLSQYYFLGNLTANEEPSLITAKFEADYIKTFIMQNAVCVIGPGLNEVDAKEVISHCINRDLIMVLDAGILSVLPENYDFNNTCVLTPHIGEAAKLLNVTNEYVLANPIEAALNLNEKYRTPIILKGASSVIVYNGMISFITNGDPCLATAGSGDVLAGITAGYIARYGFSKQVIEQAVFKHAQLGNYWARNKKTNLIASDLLKGI